MSNSKMERMQWFHDAKFGMFIHFGLYSLLGGDFRGEKNTGALSEWIMKNMQIPLCEYRKLAQQFNPQNWNAEEIVKLCAESGMKYLCITAKHHDGFAMYNSKVSDYNIMHTPFKKDIVMELAQQCKKYGITFCVYYSQMQDWADKNGFGNTWDYQEDTQNFEKYYSQKVRPQVTELLSNYGQIGMIWFDTPYSMPKALCEDLKKLVYDLQPNCLINGRIGYGLGDFLEAGDNCMPARAWKCAWELPMTLNDTWGYDRTDQNWKSAEDVICNLIKTSSRGGNLLLNIGPDENGKVPAESIKILNNVGKWVQVYGDSVFASNCVPDFPYEHTWGCFTMKGMHLFMHIQKCPINKKNITVYGFLSRVKQIRDMRTGETIKFEVFYDQARDEKRLIVVLGDVLDEEGNAVLDIELDEGLRVAELKS